MYPETPCQAVMCMPRYPTASGWAQGQLGRGENEYYRSAASRGYGEGCGRSKCQASAKGRHGGVREVGGEGYDRQGHGCGCPKEGGVFGGVREGVGYPILKKGAGGMSTFVSCKQSYVYMTLYVLELMLRVLVVFQRFYRFMLNYVHMICAYTCTY